MGLQRLLKPLHMRYVECNPVRASIVQRAEEYRWSSAAAHCTKMPDSLLSPDSSWGKQFAAVDNWSAWLQMADDVKKLDMLRHHADKGLPCGAADFVQALGVQVGRPLEPRPLLKGTLPFSLLKKDV